MISEPILVAYPVRGHWHPTYLAATVCIETREVAVPENAVTYPSPWSVLAAAREDTRALSSGRALADLDCAPGYGYALSADGEEYIGRVEGGVLASRPPEPSRLLAAELGPPLRTVRVGEHVAVSRSHTRYSAEVTKVTATQVTADGRRFTRRYGTEVGSPYSGGAGAIQRSTLIAARHRAGREVGRRWRLALDAIAAPASEALAARLRSTPDWSPEAVEHLTQATAQHQAAVQAAYTALAAALAAPVLQADPRPPLAVALGLTPPAP